MTLAFFLGAVLLHSRGRAQLKQRQPGCSEAAEVIALAVMGLKLVRQDS